MPMLFRFLFAIVPLLVAVFSASAEQSVEKAEQQMTVMPQIEVTAKRPDRLTVSEVLDKSLLEDLPSSNGNITDKLTVLPGVQASDSVNNSRQAGEIRPAELSISGGRVHSNNYIFDGASYNSLLDPAFKNINNIDNIPGHSQDFFLLDHIVKDISVMRANISARYGSFTGGVVEINSIDPDEEFGGEVTYRTTRSEWTQFHLDPDAKEDFNNSGSADDQPDFTKHQSSYTLNVPFTEKIGVVFNYSRLQSSIPLQRFDTQKKQHRLNENFFIKSVANPQSGTKISLSWTYAPFKEDYYLKDTLSSNYSLKGGGYSVIGKLEQQYDIADAEFNLSFNQSKNSREAPDTFWSWRSTESKNWGKTVSFEGGRGDLDKKDKTFSASSHIEFNPIPTRSITHQFNTGIEVERSEANFDRTEILTRYSGAKTDDLVVCNGNTIECVDNEQFFYFKNIYPTDSAHAEITNYHAYLENNMEISRLTLRPGLRISYNDYQNNTDFAPRFAVSYDLFDNQDTLFIGGYSRYYGANLLTLKLEEDKALFETQCRGDLKANGLCDLATTDYSKPWIDVQRTSFPTSRVSDLKTPYSDEYTLAIRQALLGGQLEITYIDREYKDQIVSVILDKDDEGIVFKEWSNDGRRSHQEVSLSWQRSWAKHYFTFNATWQETKSNSLSYSDSFRQFEDPTNTDELVALVWFKGRLINRNRLPINDYNRPWKGSLIYTAELPHGFSFTNTTNYRSRYRGIKEIRSGTVKRRDGTEVDVRDLDNDYFAKVTNSSATTFDWVISWQSPDWRDNNLKFTLEVLNLFNKKIPDGPKEDEYLLGRQFWAEVKYKF